MEKQSLSKEDKKTIEEINEKLSRMISFRFIFFKGIINGLATFLGATIVAAFVLAVLSRFIDSVEDVPVLEDVVDSVELSDTETVNNN